MNSLQQIQEESAIRSNVHRAVRAMECCAKCGMVTEFCAVVNFAGRDEVHCLDCKYDRELKLAMARKSVPRFTPSANEIFGLGWV